MTGDKPYNKYDIFTNVSMEIFHTHQEFRPLWYCQWALTIRMYRIWYPC